MDVACEGTADAVGDLNVPFAWKPVVVARPMSKMNNDLFLGVPHWPSGMAGWAQAISSRGTIQAAADACGVFAAGLRLSNGATFLAVDRFARQTLCWRLTNGVLVFGERGDQLGGTEIDPQAVFEYLFFHVVPAPRTIFKDVNRIPAGHCAVLDKCGGDVRPYTQVKFRYSRNPSFETLKTELIVSQGVV